MSKVLYLSGPMTGVPQFNIPLFDAVTLGLRAEGYTIISPAELDSEEVRAAGLASQDGKYGADGRVGHETWGDMLARDVKMLADGAINGIALLPGWEKSRGARLEVFVGLLTNKEFYTVHYARPWPNGGEGSFILGPATSEWVEHMLALTWDGVKVYRTGAE